MKNSFKDKLLPVLARISRNPDELAKTIQKSFASSESLFEADIRKLRTITENESATELFLIIAALASRKCIESFKFGKTHTEDEIKDFLTGFYINASVESVTILPVDKSGKILAIDTISDGTVNLSSIIPRQIIERLTTHGVDSFIMAHNHPGGLPEPSDGDIASSKNLAMTLNACGIHLLAHYVVANRQCNKIDF